ncbi:hypothetical protein NA57DRAFT_34782 [Rhizodiscina lignyota]|uniref:Glycosyl transferase family 25 domain-containing protein n=1 Tax=Rhizodiscina lignyota TaxID=1504668 RepID=A0A9P4MD05_9PEZI|nr:hypothetical protein NA57DRAFT_34782 [Rhizodiscina lignyota]
MNRDYSSSLRSATVPSNFTKSDLLRDVFNKTLGFQKIFVINLPSRTDHRDAITLAAALTDLELEFVDGVTEVAEKALPPGGKEVKLNKGGLGNWRAHLNIMRMIVERNITSALILEDDADWDIRIKSQMYDFAQASRSLLQPLQNQSSQYLDPTYPKPIANSQPQNFELGSASVSTPSSTPYGDVWDLFWLGHCGTRFPRASDGNAPLGRAIIPNDLTVPEQQHLKMEFGSLELLEEYPSHTRVVHRAWQNTCTIGYAVTQSGARSLLYEVGISAQKGTTDMELRSFCHGSDGRRIHTCLTAQPQIFEHHSPVGVRSTFSDISDHGQEYNDFAYTCNIRWSTRVNFPKLVAGEKDYIDSFKDGESSDHIRNC